MKRKLAVQLLAGILVLAALLMTACGGKQTDGGATPQTGPEHTGDSAGTAAVSKDFTYVCGTEPTTLDPHLVNDNATARASGQIFETLVYRDTDSSKIGRAHV